MTTFNPKGAYGTMLKNLPGSCAFRRNGVWYPRGLRHEHELRHYSQCFSTCEVSL